MIPGGFAALIALGTVLLMLPAASESGVGTGAVDALFTATSAVCVTGLTRFDTADHWSGFGEIVLLLLIQLGGLGITSSTAFLFLFLGRRIGLGDRDLLGVEVIGVGERNLSVLLRRLIGFVFVIEFATFVLLVPWTASDEGWGIRALWQSAFHSISAFNNAGFDLRGGSRGFSEASGEMYPLLVLGFSSLLGSLSFITVFDLRLPRRRWPLDLKLVLIGTLALLVGGMLVLLVGEGVSGGALSELSPTQQLANAFFLSVNARTTGMSTIDISQLRDSTAAFLLFLMFVGGVSTSTAGGIKVGSLMVSVLVVRAVIKGENRIAAFGREVPAAAVMRAITLTTLGLFAIGAGVWLLELTEDVKFLPLVFDTVSALGTVGWTDGVAAAASPAGAIIFSILMYAGRLGPLLIALGIPDRPLRRYRYPEGSVRIG